MIRVVEVSPRDGLQNETRIIPTDVKVSFIECLSRSGVHEIEVGAFVSPAKIPQLADTQQVFEAMTRTSGVVYSALVPNERGLDQALAAKVDKIAIFTAASETFNRRNINASIDDSFKRFEPVVPRAKRAGVLVRGYVSTAFWCPYEGRVEPEAAADVVQRLIDLGVDEVSIGDTIGKASPEDVKSLLALLAARMSFELLNMHLHDTFGRGSENARIAWTMGIKSFDSSTGGIGGCPFAPGAPGNLATRSLVATLRSVGAAVDVDLEVLDEARTIIEPYLARKSRHVGSDSAD